MQLFIIFFGTGPVRSTLKEGHFNCPQCESSVPYRHRKVTKFFTLFFLPIFPVGSPIEYVECGRCNNTFIPRVLDNNSGSGSGSNDDFMAIYEQAIRHSMVRVMLADGHIDEQEKVRVREVINQFGHNDLTMSELENYIDKVKREGEDVETYLKKVGPSLNDHGKESIVRVALSVADADGHIDDSEIRMITQMANAMEMSSAHLRGIIAEFKEKKELPA
jgi:uncharacterized tellurite resistance protein B-like protein